LRKHFGSLAAVDGVDLQVYPGQIYGLVGPDGAGKTTTIRMLCGALRIEEGQVAIAGYDVRARTEHARAQIGYLPQRFSLYEDMTVMENLRFFAEVRGLAAQDWRPRCLEILTFVGLDRFTDRLAGHLSGGMKQKLGLAAALVHQPRVLLLDEPTTGVDPVTRQDFWQLIIRLVSSNGDGVAVLVSTPYMDEAARCTRVGFLRSGRLIVEDTPAGLRSLLRDRIVELSGRPKSTLRNAALAAPGVEDVQMFGDRIHLRVASGEAGAVIANLSESLLRQDAEIDRIRPIPAGLEDVFISLLEAKNE
jgi:ABC-2 type transport system ATP-binding protein